ncbi:MAG: hypothetical protein M0C28_07595 [Candidatus Moduliflexus flocculans]|nr:hypothetical protein [Candidatus Moduliflexus flocculans]
MTDVTSPPSTTLLQEPACLVGVGNHLRRDDGVGPWIVEAVREAAAGTGLALVERRGRPRELRLPRSPAATRRTSSSSTP